MANEIAIKQDSNILEQVVIHGDLAELTPGDRIAYYAKVCESLGLNPFTRPFEYIKLNNKLTLYARRDATDQLRAIKGISITITGRDIDEGAYIVTAKATDRSGRFDESTGVVDIANLKGDFRANAMMKAETKAKRRVTLSIVGLGWLDETEVTDIPKKDVQTVEVDVVTGEIKPEVPPDAPQSATGTVTPPTAPITPTDIPFTPAEAKDVDHAALQKQAAIPPRTGTASEAQLKFLKSFVSKLGDDRIMKLAHGQLHIAEVATDYSNLTSRQASELISLCKLEK